ncbi:MAG TPA: hypothetical protein VL485_33435 [Ktedonobacteraceae bacterium]|jgi:hypothetical protein|nr:hypothetical protein [Ktedonobacteraceae bacterium]
MRPRIDLRFRPSLIIFIDETGSQICEQLKLIARFTDFDPVLCQSVALLQVDSQTGQATPVPLGEEFADERTPKQEGPLEQIFEKALRDVQNRRRLQNIHDAGYPVPNPRTQIFLVGDAHSPELAKIHATVRHRLRRNRLGTLVCYVVNSYHMRQRSGPLGAGEVDVTLPLDNNAAYWIDRQVPNFCFLYEDLLAYPAPAFVNQEDSHYATAEGIFALLATSLTTEPFFEEQMRTGIPFHGYYESVGTLSTSLIAFPRNHVLEYCSARLGIALMEQWRHDLREQQITNDVRKNLQNNAIEAVRDIGQWIRDSQERPLANTEEEVSSKGKEAIPEPLRWPNLNILRSESRTQPGDPSTPVIASNMPAIPIHDQRRLHHNLEAATEDLFALFSSQDIEKSYHELKQRFASWTKLVLQRGNMAVEAYKEWDRAATQAWTTAGNRVNAEIKARINYLWANDENGIEMASVYVQELDDQLRRLINAQSRWREIHDAEYKQFLAVYERIAEGPWIVPEGTTSILNDPSGPGGGPATPKMGNVSLNSQTTVSGDANTGIVGGDGDGTPPSPVTSHQHLPPHEEQLAQQLEQRVTWYQNRIPPIATQTVVAFPFILALILTALVWLPVTLFSIALASAATTLLIGIAHFSFFQHHQKKVKLAKEELLNFYRRYYAHRSETREDRLRLLVTGPLRRDVLAIRERLDNMQNFINQTRDTFDADTRRAEQELFQSPASARDIFVANSERLQQSQHNTLEDFAGQITKLRMKEPVEEWHRNSPDLKRHMIQMFRQGNQSILSIDETEAQDLIRTFATDVTRAYFHGPLVELQYALDKRDTWREALDRVENPLYQAEVGIREPQFIFVCGQERDVTKGTSYIPAHAHPVRISDKHEWVLLVAFFRGGLPTTINPEVLFPTEDDLIAQLTPDDDDDIPSTGSLPDDDDALPSSGSLPDDDDIPSTGSLPDDDALPSSTSFADDDDALPHHSGPLPDDDDSVPPAQAPEPEDPLPAKHDDDHLPRARRKRK